MPTEQSLEQLFITLRKGMEATTMLAVVQPLLEARKAALLRDAITVFRGGTMTGEQSLLAIASLAENEQLLLDLQGLESAGQRADKLLQKKV